MPAHVDPNIGQKPVAAERILGVDFGGHLNNGVLLTGTPTVTATALTISTGAVIASDVTISAIAVLSSARVINNRLVPVGGGVIFKVAGGTAGTRYRFTITATGTNGEVFVGVCYLDVVAT